MTDRDARTTLRTAFDAALRAADPSRAVSQALPGHRDAIARAEHVHVAALGKAAIAMTRAARPALAGREGRIVVVTTAGAADDPLEVAEVIEGGHPIPDEGSLRGGDALLSLAEGAGPNDLVLALISGGGSALAAAPRPGFTLDDKIRVTRLLLGSGADITEMNVVRRALSRLKGGGLARAALPAPVLALILSDVPGDDPADVASGPTAAAPAAPSPDEVLLRHNLLGDLPDDLVRRIQETPRSGASPSATNEIVASNAQSVAAAEAALSEAGHKVHRLSGWLGGDVADATTRLLDTMREAISEGVTALVAGGETTVRVTGDGNGGRNQELALRMALAEADAPLDRRWAFFSGGTDGRDGPTDAAGGFADPGTLDRIRAAGLAPRDELARNNAYFALDAAGDLLRTGPTGTNVADIQITLLGKA